MLTFIKKHSCDNDSKKGNCYKLASCCTPLWLKTIKEYTNTKIDQQLQRKLGTRTQRGRHALHRITIPMERMGQVRNKQTKQISYTTLNYFTITIA